MPNLQNEYTTVKGVPVKLHEHCHSALSERRLPSGGAASLEFPCGGVDIGEAPEAGAIQELREETGYRVSVSAVTFLGVLGPDTATLNGLNHVFVVDIPDDLVPAGFDTDEITRLRRVTATELRSLIRTNKIFDGQSLAAYSMLQSRE